MKAKNRNSAPCPSCGRTMRRHENHQNEMTFWRCESCIRAYSDNAGSVGVPLPLTLPQISAIVGLAHRYKSLDGFKKAYDLKGMSIHAILSQLEQAVTWGFLEAGKDGGFFVPTDQGKVILEGRVHTCPTCGGVAILMTPEGAPDFWRCIECETTVADENGTPATPCTCEKCGGKSVTRFAAADHPGVFFWACGACRRIFEDIDGSAGRCTDDINE